MNPAPIDLRVEYLRLYRKADEILKGPNNPCQIEVVDGKAHCRMTRMAKWFAPPGQLCCRGCNHLGPNGCTVEALSCKLGWCYTSKSTIEGMSVNDHPMFLALRAVRDEALSMGVPLLWRHSVDDTFSSVR